MTHALQVVALLAAAGAMFAQEPVPPPTATSTPAEQYRALLDEYKPKPGGPKSDAERVQWIGEGFRRGSELAGKLVDLAAAHPDDPIAIEALLKAVWQVNTTPWPASLVGPDPARPRAFELLQRRYLASEKLESLCQRISYGHCREYETFLRAVLAASPHAPVKAQACVGLARFLTNRLGKLDSLADDPEAAKQHAALFGDDYLAELRRQDRGKVQTEIAELFTRAEREFGELPFSEERKVADVARAGRFEIEHLQVGCEAPAIEGDDQDGQRFKLADYRGKVVLLDFWHWH